MRNSELPACCRCDRQTISPKRVAVAVQQVTSYQVLFDQALTPGGIYVIEDIETSYWKAGQDLYGQPVTRCGQSEAETVVNKFKQLVDVGTSPWMLQSEWET
jgi:hypothetical protein